MQKTGLSSAEHKDAGPSAGMYSRQTARVALFARLVLGDLLSFLVAFSVAAEVRDSAWLSPNGFNLMFIVVPLYLLIATGARAYTLEVMVDYGESLRRVTIALLQSFLIVVAMLFALQIGQETSRLAFFASFAIAYVLLAFFRFMAVKWVKRALKGDLLDELVIVDGVERPDVQSSHIVNAHENGISPDLGDPAILERFATITQIYDRVLVACPIEKRAAWANVLKTVDVSGEIIVGQSDEIGVIGLDTFRGLNTLVVTRGPLSLMDRAQKRLFDLAIAVPVLLFLAPLMIVVAIAIKLDSRGPVFFRQARVGRNNVPFQIFKFRSMRQEASDLTGAQSTRRDDDRISRFGAFIRKTSIDELPQLLNVLKGDMSIVGPRPHALGSTADDQLFWEISQRYWERHVLKPGITGLAQVRGYRGATERSSDLTDRLNSDLEYLANWRLWNDITILVLTLRVLVHPNAY